MHYHNHELGNGFIIWRQSIH